MSTTRPSPVLFYDGDCGLCNAVVRFILKHDRREELAFSPLQGPTAQAFLRNRGLPTEDFDSIVFVDDLDRPDTEHHVRTAGALRALQEMGGGWRKLARVLGWVPACVRDAVYKGIARVRYRIFGEYRPTPLPDPRWAARFLD